MEKTFIITCIIFSFLMFSISLFADEKEILEKLKNDQDYQRINLEVQSITCNWDDIVFLYDEYKTFFGERWSDIKHNYKCEDVSNFIMEKERKRLTFNLEFKTPKEGIAGSHFFLFGHYVRPPYKVELDEKEKTIIVNGVSLASIRVPRIITPKMEKPEPDYDVSYSLGLMGISFNEDKLRKLEKRTTDQLINLWLKTYSKSEVINKLNAYLNNLKNDEEISDYWIYDKDNILYDIKYSLITYKDVPQKYYFSENEWKEMVKENPVLEYTDKQKNIYLTELREKSRINEFNSTKQILSDKVNNYFINAPLSGSTTMYLTTDSLKMMVYAILSEGSDYQKIIYLTKIFPDPIDSGQIVFNSNRIDYLYSYKDLKMR